MDEECRYLLNEWGMGDLISLFQENLVDTAALKVLTENDLENLIKPIGLRSKFRENWKIWTRNLAAAADQSENANNSYVSDDDVIELSNQILSGIVDTSSDYLPDLDIQTPTSPPLEFTELVPRTSEPQPQTSTPTKKPYTPLSNNFVKDLLAQTVDGKSIVTEGLRNDGLLSASRRKELGRLIIRSLLDQDPNLKIQATTFTRLALQIKEVFPKEGAAVYFTSSLPANAHQRKRNASGVLYEAYISRRRKLRLIGCLPGTSRSRSSSIALNFLNCKASSGAEETDVRSPEDTPADPVIDEHIKWLERSVQPWALVEIYWSDTTEYRLKEIETNPNLTVAEYFKRFPILKTQEGIRLLIHDFDFKEPGKGNSFFASIVLLREKIISLAAEKAKLCRDKQLKRQIDELLIAINDQWIDSKSVVALLLIPYIINLPTGGLKKKGKPVWKPSRSEVRDGFIATVNTEADVKTAVDAKKQKLETLGRTFQPLIVLVGERLDYSCLAFVVVDNTYYRFTSPLQAIDSAYKLFHATGACYPEESYTIWYFIQRAMYDMTTKYDRPCQPVLHLMSDLGCSNE